MWKSLLQVELASVVSVMFDPVASGLASSLQVHGEEALQGLRGWLVSGSKDFGECGRGVNDGEDSDRKQALRLELSW